VLCRLRLECDGTRAETRFRLSAKRTSPFKSAGASVQSTTGSREVRISGGNAGYTMFRGSVKGTGCPLHSPVSPSLSLSESPCAITFQLDSTTNSVVNHLNTAVHLENCHLSAGRPRWQRIPHCARLKHVTNLLIACTLALLYQLFLRPHSVPHREHTTFNRINQPDAAISQVSYLSFRYSSTCFGHPHAHHQELHLQ
jgi:hypothetical protein